ncbi:hypothetical protein SDC9_154607 [bioreactor metagenome]|uniref:Uncharacterized protein n=1 Tax=bioreactor metagenome TaxID=1076179 RepID=A0A645EZ78_9ZZZZ
MLAFFDVLDVRSRNAHRNNGRIGANNDDRIERRGNFPFFCIYFNDIPVQFGTNVAILKCFGCAVVIGLRICVCGIRFIQRALRQTNFVFVITDRVCKSVVFRDAVHRFFLQAYLVVVAQRLVSGRLFLINFLLCRRISRVGGRQRVPFGLLLIPSTFGQEVGRELGELGEHARQ